MIYSTLCFDGHIVLFFSADIITIIMFCRIMKAEADRRQAAREEAMSDYTSALLGRAHNGFFAEERVRNLASNCKVLPPLPPGQAVDPSWASVYANASKVPLHGHGHAHGYGHAHGNSSYGHGYSSSSSSRNHMSMRSVSSSLHM